MDIEITKEFLDQALTVETLKKYRDHKTQHYFEQEYINWAYNHLIGLDRTRAMRLMTIKHNELMDLGRPWKKRSEFAKIMHCINYELDHGYKKGQTVDYWFSKTTKRTGVIRSINDRNQVRFDDIILSVDRIVVDVPEPRAKKEIEEKPKGPEQLTLFGEMNGY